MSVAGNSLPAGTPMAVTDVLLNVNNAESCLPDAVDGNMG